MTAIQLPLIITSLDEAEAAVRAFAAKADRIAAEVEDLERRAAEALASDDWERHACQSEGLS